MTSEYQADLFRRTTALFLYDVSTIFSLEALIHLEAMPFSIHIHVYKTSLRDPCLVGTLWGMPANCRCSFPRKCLLLAVMKLWLLLLSQFQTVGVVHELAE